MSVSAPTSSVSYDTQVAETIAELISLLPFRMACARWCLPAVLREAKELGSTSGSRVRLAGDADFLGVFDDHAPLPPPDRVARLKRVAEERLASAGIEAHIGLSPVRLATCAAFGRISFRTN